jgi:uncharacterized protein YceH (UPF0502 family)
MTELLLRGEQTLGELRGRAARMEPIADMAALKPVVEALVKRGLMVELTAPGRGQVVSHNLYKERELTEIKAQFANYVPPAGYSDDAPPAREAPRPAAAPVGSSNTQPRGVTADAFAELVVEVAELRTEVMRLKDQVQSLESKLQAVMS